MNDIRSPLAVTTSLELKERYVVDKTGSRIAVLLEIEEYQKVLDALEELEAISAYDEAKTEPDKVMPFEQASAEIESQRDVPQVV